MRTDIKDIWIESEQSGAVNGGTPETNDNSDVIVTFLDGTRHVATCFTYQNIEHLRQKNKKTGECLNGKYFFGSDMLIVERINRKDIEEIISHLISENEFDLIFNKIE
jgi:hypothetical protein